jgi:hypothetical protein
MTDTWMRVGGLGERRLFLLGDKKIGAKLPFSR